MDKKLKSEKVAQVIPYEYTDTSPKPKFTIYYPTAANLDSKAEELVRYPGKAFLNKDEAIAWALNKITEQHSTHIEFHKAGTCKVYEGRNVEYHPVGRWDCFFNKSNFGPFRCAMYIEEIEVW